MSEGKANWQCEQQVNVQTSKTSYALTVGGNNKKRIKTRPPLDLSLMNKRLKKIIDRLRK